MDLIAISLENPISVTKYRSLTPQEIVQRKVISRTAGYFQRLLLYSIEGRERTLAFRKVLIDEKLPFLKINTEFYIVLSFFYLFDEYSYSGAKIWGDSYSRKIIEYRKNKFDYDMNFLLVRQMRNHQTHFSNVVGQQSNGEYFILKRDIAASPKIIDRLKPYLESIEKISLTSVIDYIENFFIQTHIDIRKMFENEITIALDYIDEFEKEMLVNGINGTFAFADFIKNVEGNPMNIKVNQISEFNTLRSTLTEK
ncbi:hypothetical protein [Bacillus thuringiensis]|uniref:hypothetical protein n=1 Tax=Bacillus thuringiensis TaxID=1428 RepID=UPI000BFE6228|nr:hypothetical protein [Bacillus thuringiensis]PGW74483.1 hypothetical protein COE21_21335 [Bacillus thuringiensis]